MPAGHWEALAQLRSYGFRVNDANRVFDTVDEVLRLLRPGCWNNGTIGAYEADGLVVKVDSLTQQNALGFAGREPRWAIRPTSSPPSAPTPACWTIIINVGRTGSLNPQAILEPVVVSGATVQHASRHNEEDIHRKDIRIGDLVEIERAGDVIPHVLGHVPVPGEERGPEFRMPERCPECDTTVVKVEGDAMHRCPNSACPAQFFESLKHFVSRSAMDIDGLGERWCRILIDRGLVSDVSHVYGLKMEQLTELDRMGEKLATRILDNVEASKRRPLARVLFALGILHVGAEVAELLAGRYASLDDIAAATEDELTEIEGIGPRIAESIVEYFATDGNQRTIAGLRDAGVQLWQELAPVDESAQPWKGQTFVITGTLASMTRREAESRVKALGAATTSSVSRKTNWLVAGESAGSKLASAERLGVPVLDENALLALLNDPASLVSAAAGSSDDEGQQGSLSL